jgi:O-antigen ligase
VSRERAPLLAVAVAVFLAGSQFYTDLSALTPQPASYVVLVPEWGAWALVAVLVVSGGYCAVRVARSGGRWGGTPVPLTMLLATAALCGILGFDPLKSLGVVVLTALACAMHAAVVRFYTRPHLASVMFTTFFVVGIAASLLALAMQVLRKPILLALVNNERAAGLFTTPNQFAAFLVMFIAAGCAVMLGAPRSALRYLGAGAAVVGLVSMAATFSRGGWIGLATAAVAFAVFVRAWRTAGVVAVVAVFIAFSTFGNDRHHESGDAFSRVPALEAGITTFALFPLTGVGPACYDRVHPAVRPVTAQNEDSYASLHPHNVVLSILTEEGVLGLAVVVYAAWRFVVGFRARLAGAFGGRRYAAYALAAGLFGTLGHGMVDLVGVAELTFVWLPFSAITLAVAAHGVLE